MKHGSFADVHKRRLDCLAALELALRANPGATVLLAELVRLDSDLFGQVGSELEFLRGEVARGRESMGGDIMRLQATLRGGHR